VICSGKRFYDLDRARQPGDATTLLRIEQLYPFPADDLAELLENHFPSDWVWAQEEPANMGAASYCADRFSERLGKEPRIVSREESASPATGSMALHRAEQEKVVAAALGRT
jgi:2-oxoglutarate dehydrogenase complex dehydrogenase (E1) component-like enzyme